MFEALGHQNKGDKNQGRGDKYVLSLYYVQGINTKLSCCTILERGKKYFYSNFTDG